VLVAFHRSWAFVVIVVNLVSGIWGLVLYRKRASPGRAWWATLLTGHTVLLVQVIVGVILFSHHRPPNKLHPFYGFVLITAAVLSYAFRSEGARRALLVLSGVALFIGVVGVRAALTGFR
jgi:uncharacterized membrane protein SirB2